MVGRGKRLMAWSAFGLLAYLSIKGSTAVLTVVGFPFVLLIAGLMGLDVGQELGKKIDFKPPSE